MAAQEGERMDKGELSLYRDTYNAGARNALMEFAARLKEEIKQREEWEEKHKNGFVKMGLQRAADIIDKDLKEALDEINRGSSTEG